jgi:hypothetical protein
MMPPQDIGLVVVELARPTPEGKETYSRRKRDLIVGTHVPFDVL